MYESGFFLNWKKKEISLHKKEIQRKYNAKEQSFVTKSDFIIPISLQPNVVELRLFKLNSVRSNNSSLKHQMFTPSDCKDSHIWLCDKDSIASTTPPPYTLMCSGCNWIN